MRLRIWSCHRVVKVPLGKAFAAALAFMLPLALLSAEPRWKIQFIYDHAGSNFSIEDLDCPTTRHCVAAGMIDDKNGHQQGAVVVTGDGGEHWTQYQVKEQPISVFFLNDSAGWMVTAHGLWSTVEGGRAWTKVASRKGILRAWFLDTNHGYIAGLQGLVQETTDGGKTWAKLEASGQAPNEKSVNYNIVSFQGEHGFLIGGPASPASVLGTSKPAPQADGKLTLLETLDGGKKWKYSTISVDGELAQFRVSKKGFVVSLIVYPDAKSALGSAMFKTPLGSPNAHMIFGERDRAATDFALLDNGGAVVVAIEPPGNSTLVPIPGKLKVLESGNLKVWHEMDVDYRAIGQRAVIAAPDDRHMWVATDTGAILSRNE